MRLSLGRRGRYALRRLARIVDRKQLIRKPSIGSDRLGQEIAAGCIVLMERVNADAIDGRFAGSGYRLPPGVVPAVADADPIDGNQHDRFLVVRLQDDPAGAERIVHALGRRYQAITQS